MAGSWENKGINNTYKDLIKLDSATDNTGITGSLVNISDGYGVASALSLSTGAASIAGTFVATSSLTIGGTASISGDTTIGGSLEVDDETDFNDVIMFQTDGTTTYDVNDPNDTNYNTKIGIFSDIDNNSGNPQTWEQLQANSGSHTLEITLPKTLPVWDGSAQVNQATQVIKLSTPGYNNLSSTPNGMAWLPSRIWLNTGVIELGNDGEHNVFNGNAATGVTIRAGHGDGGDARQDFSIYMTAAVSGGALGETGVGTLLGASALVNESLNYTIGGHAIRVGNAVDVRIVQVWKLLNETNTYLNSTGNAAMSTATGAAPLVTIQGDLKVRGNSIQSSTGTPITFIGADTRFAGYVRVDGNSIQNNLGNAVLGFSGNDVAVTGGLTSGGDVNGASPTEMGYLSGVTSAIQTQLTTNLNAIALNTAKTTNATHTGDVTGATALTIAADAVTYAKMQNVSADERILGRISGADGVIEELTAANVVTMCDILTTTTAASLYQTSLGAAATYLSIATASNTYQPKVAGVSNTEIGYLDGVTSAIQTQIDTKQASLTFGIVNGNSLIVHEPEGGNPSSGDFARFTANGIEGVNIILAAGKDEDNMASNSATHFPTQQSVKAYVDANAGGGGGGGITTGKAIAMAMIFG